MAARGIRSISLPIILSTVSVCLGIALLVAWTIVIARSESVVEDIVANTVLLVTGIVALVVIMSVLVLFSVFLVREIREVRRQTSFIDSVTHELKSPLAAIKLCLETQNRPDLPGEKHLQLRGMMLDDVDRLTAFIDRVLAATRRPTEQTSLPLQELSLDGLVRRCVAAVTRRSHQPEEVVRVDVPADLRLTSDELALTAVLENLIDNAIKYSQEPAEVVVTARAAAKGGVVLEVRDRGIGIPRKDIRRVFERFYRVPVEDVRSRRGTGLGLYVVSLMVHSLGGKVEAQSPGPGQGTTMRVTLPSRPRAQALRLGG